MSKDLCNERILKGFRIAKEEGKKKVYVEANIARLGLLKYQRQISVVSLP